MSSFSARELVFYLDRAVEPGRRGEPPRLPLDVLDLLAAFASRGWRVRVISRRPAAEAWFIVPLPGVEIHGGPSTTLATPDARLDDLQQKLDLLAVVLASALSVDLPGAGVEITPSGITLHSEMVRSHDLGCWNRRAEALARAVNRVGLEAVRGHRKIEIRRRTSL